MIIACTRFTTKTYNENIKWKMAKKWRGCVYGFNEQLPKKIPYNSDVYIIDMNNDTNKIMGIGLINYDYKPSNRSRIYQNHNYNRYVYKSKYYINRYYLLKRHKEIIELLEQRLFYGHSHFKRQVGLTVIPIERLIVTYPKVKYLCKKCGLPKKNHVCLGEKKVNTDSICKLCGKFKRGHICTQHKKNSAMKIKIESFFSKLFV